MPVFTAGGKPKIGVTGPDKGGLAAWYFTHFAIWRAGGKAKRVTPSRPCDMRELAGLIIGGGADVDPSLYGAEPDEILEQIKQERSIIRSLLTRLLYPLLFFIRKLFSTKVSQYGDSTRDALETRLLEQALELQRPVLGICRGAQLINVHLGGNLHQNIQGFYVETPHLRTIFPRKDIVVSPNTRLASILRGCSSKVNALHYQAIKELGHNLVISARERSPDIVQAIEHRDRFVIGVQWHPEYLFREQDQQALFHGLVEEARTCCTATE